MRLWPYFIPFQILDWWHQCCQPWNRWFCRSSVLPVWACVKPSHPRICRIIAATYFLHCSLPEAPWLNGHWTFCFQCSVWQSSPTFSSCFMKLDRHDCKLHFDWCTETYNYEAVIIVCLHSLLDIYWIWILFLRLNIRPNLMYRLECNIVSPGIVFTALPQLHSLNILRSMEGHSFALGIIC